MKPPGVAPDGFNMVNKVKDNQYSRSAQESADPDILINCSVSPLDLPLTLTRFQDRWAKAKTEKATSLRGLADAIKGAPTGTVIPRCCHKVTP